MSDIQLNEVIERYLTGEMTAEEQIRFEILREQNAEVNKRFTEGEIFGDTLQQYAERVNLESRLNAIHSEIDVHSLQEELMIHPSWMVQLWRNHHSKISVAASIAIFAILSTLFVTDHFNNHSQSSYQALKLQVDQVTRISRKLDKKTTELDNRLQSGGKAANLIPVKFKGFVGTGFALSANGYIVTNNHVIKDADSVYVQNADGESYRATVVFQEPQYDVAVLKIVDTSFKGLGTLPYSFKRAKSDLGEDVYTIGYPGDAIVFGPGFLTSSSGYKGDTSEYQVSIPVNPGNSGGPLLDSKGNVIGIISGRQTQFVGAAFAVKSAYLMKSIQNIPADSLRGKLSLNNKNTLSGLSRPQQVKKLQNYVFMVKVYNN